MIISLVFGEFYKKIKKIWDAIIMKRDLWRLQLDMIRCSFSQSDNDKISLLKLQWPHIIQSFILMFVSMSMISFCNFLHNLQRPKATIFIQFAHHCYKYRCNSLKWCCFQSTFYFGNTLWTHLSNISWCYFILCLDLQFSFTDSHIFQSGFAFYWALKLIFSKELCTSLITVYALW